ncbi:MAG: LysR family transcriptional regulator [Eubacterium sp.]|nr:LysR family transcriptional regulator [Eubacterium sp.]
MELLQLRYFKAAAELENFSAVAERFYVPQPSISATIKKLEEELGVKLFDRNGKRITLNSNGKIFYEKVAAAINSIDDGVGSLQSEKKNIVLYPQAGGRFLSLLIADFHISRNDVFLSTTGYSQDLQNHYDFTFMQPDGDMSEFEYVELMRDEIVLIACKKNKYAKVKGEVSLKDLQYEKFIAHYPAMNLRYFTDHLCEEQAGFRPGVVYETDDNQTIRYLVSEDKGIALLPKAFLELQPLKDTKIIPLKEKAYRVLALAWRKDKKLDEIEKEFVEYTKNWFKKF